MQKENISNLNEKKLLINVNISNTKMSEISNSSPNMLSFFFIKTSRNITIMNKFEYIVRL